MATKKHKHDITDEWWETLLISPHASVRDIHQAYETLRMSYLPINRDRSIPVSAEVSDQLQKLDRAFRMALDSKNPATPPRKKTKSSASAQAAPQTQTSAPDPFQSVVQEWSKTSSQNLASAPTDSATQTKQTKSTPSNSNSPANTPASAPGSSNQTSSKKGKSGYWLLFIFVVFGLGGYLFGNDSTPVSPAANPNRSNAPAAPRASPSSIPAQVPSMQYTPAPTVADPLVQAVQQELNKKGFNAGVADGIVGRQTKDAISAAQSAFNMAVDGVASEALLRALRRY